jgi:outer membrane protein assembly factor BamB
MLLAADEKVVEFVIAKTVGFRDIVDDAGGVDKLPEDLVTRLSDTRVLHGYTQPSARFFIRTRGDRVWLTAKPDGDRMTFKIDVITGDRKLEKFTLTGAVGLGSTWAVVEGWDQGAYVAVFRYGKPAP